MTEKSLSAWMRALYGIALLATSLALGLTVTHVLQAPGSRGLGGAEWLDVMHTFYGGFAVVGGIAEILGFLTTGALTTIAFSQRKALPATALLVATLCMLGTLLCYWFGNRPVNTLVTGWTAATLPSDWMTHRDAWETAHALSAGLSAVALIAIAIVLLSTAHPATHSKTLQ